MKKKKNKFDPFEEPETVLDFEPNDSPAPSDEKSRGTQKEKPPVLTDNAPLFFEPGEDDVKELTPKKKQESSPQPSLRFTVKTVRLNGEALPEGTRLADAAKRLKGLETKEEKQEKKREKKKEKKEKKIGKENASEPKPQPLPAPPTEEKVSLEKIFSEAPVPPEEPKEEAKSSKLGLLDYVRYAMLFICFSVFLYSSYTLVDSLISRAQSRSEYDQLSDSFHTESPFAALRLPAALPNAASVDLLSAYVGVQPEEYLPSVKDENAQSKIDMVNFLKNNKNKDTVGWIIIPGTNIDYPVVHTKDNDYYLRRSYYGRTNLSGTLFVDCRNSKQLMENRNTVIYGHNMNDGSMFNNLHDLKNESVFQNCSIEIATPNGIFVYQVFSVHEALDTSEYFQTDFKNDEHFASWLTEMKGESLFVKKDLELNPGDKVLTLSTCMDPIIQSEYRWAVHAKLVEIINYTP